VEGADAWFVSSILAPMVKTQFQECFSPWLNEGAGHSFSSLFVQNCRERFYKKRDGCSFTVRKSEYETPIG
jgi:hypothetical protein